MLREREQNNATMKAQAESQERNLQFLKKLEDVDKKNWSSSGQRAKAW